MNGERFHKVMGKYEAIAQRAEVLNNEISEQTQNIDKLEMSLATLFNFNEWMNDIVKEKLEKTTNSALNSIFPDKNMKFFVKPNRTKRGIFYDLYIETDGAITDVYDAKGGGVLDVIQTCLRIVYVKKMAGSLRQTMLLDEPFKNLDEERVGMASQWLKMVSEQFGIQMLIVTHIPAVKMSVEKGGAIEMRIMDGQTVIL